MIALSPTNLTLLVVGLLICIFTGPKLGKFPQDFVTFPVPKVFL
jgi:hypothetical protein